MSSTQSCKKCEHRHSCSELKQLFDIFRGSKRFSKHEELLQYFDVLSQVQNQGWLFPHNTKPCSFERPQQQIQSLIDTLIGSKPFFQGMTHSTAMTVHKNEDMQKSANKMIENKVEHCLVIDDDENIVGVMTILCLLKRFAKVENVKEFSIVSQCMDPIHSWVFVDTFRENLKSFSRSDLQYFVVMKDSEKSNDLSNFSNIVTKNQMEDYAVQSYFQRKYVAK